MGPGKARPLVRTVRAQLALEIGAPCMWCGKTIPTRGARRDARTCSQSCRQAAHRFGSRCPSRPRTTSPLRLAYADPPYPGQARRYYRDHPDYAGEVDHRELLSRLASSYDGWALSTSARALPRVLSLAAGELGLDVRVASWHRGARKIPSRWPRPGWEPVVFAGGRRYVRAASEEDYEDVLVCGVTPRVTDPRRVVGAKPAAFWWWLFTLLGALPGDRFEDLFAGSGGGSRAWALYEERALVRLECMVEQPTSEETRRARPRTTRRASTSDS